MSQKVILNKDYGGFGLSTEAYKLYAKKKGINIYKYVYHNFDYEKLYKVDINSGVSMAHYSTKDLGDIVNIKDINDNYFYLSRDYRTDPILIEVVEELGKKANGDCAYLEIVEIPDDLKYEIYDYDGFETLHEIHRKW